MKRTQTPKAAPDFHQLLERSDEIFAAISEELSEHGRRDLQKLRALTREATEIADQMSQALKQRSPASSASASFQTPISRVFLSAADGESTRSAPHDQPSRNDDPSQNANN